jgi:hypothetical protein
MSRQDDLQRLINNLNRRLQKLKEQKTLQGQSTDPKILIEIEDIEKEISKLEADLIMLNPNPLSNPSNVKEEGLRPIRILFLSANPTDTTRLRLDKEFHEINQTLRQSKFRDSFDLKQYGAVRLIDLSNYLLLHQPHIVHFSGHGNEASEIILEDDSGMGRAVSVEALSRLFSALKDNIRCVILNACYSEQQALAIAKHIDCVVGMSKAISDEHAINFATAFYQALGYGRNIKTAFDLGCVQIPTKPEIPNLITLKSSPDRITFG